MVILGPDEEKISGPTILLFPLMKKFPFPEIIIRISIR